MEEFNGFTGRKLAQPTAKQEKKIAKIAEKWSQGMAKALTSDMVREQVKNGNRDFFDRISGRRVTLCAYDFDDGCAAYADVWDADGDDHEYVGLVDISCLDPLPNRV